MLLARLLLLLLVLLTPPQLLVLLLLYFFIDFLFRIILTAFQRDRADNDNIYTIHDILFIFLCKKHPVRVAYAGPFLCILRFCTRHGVCACSILTFAFKTNHNIPLYTISSVCKSVYTIIKKYFLPNFCIKI